MPNSDKNIKFKYYHNNDDIYMKAIEFFEKQAPNKQVREKVHEILYQGRYGSFTVDSDMTKPDDFFYEANRRINFASLLVSDPQTSETIIENNVTLFHGTNSNSLKNTLKYGMCSEAEIIREGRAILTGENSRKTPRDFISFTDDMNIALDYASIEPSSDSKGKSSFGMLIGISADDIRNSKNDVVTANIRSSMPEIGIIDHLPTEYIRIIAVPQEKVSAVSKLLKKYKLEQIEVVPAEGIVNSVIIADYYKYGFSKRSRDPNCLLIKGKKSTAKTFEKKEIEELVGTRRVSKIKEIYSRIKERKERRRKGDIPNEKDSRNE